MKIMYLHIAHKSVTRKYDNKDKMSLLKRMEGLRYLASTGSWPHSREVGSAMWYMSNFKEGPPAREERLKDDLKV